MPPTNFSWFLKDRLAALGRPSSRADLEFLHSIGVKHLVSLTQSLPALHGVRINQIHIPVMDMTPPSIQQVEQFLRVMDTADLKGEAVAVHCKYGLGRVGTMLACHVLKTTHCSAQEAISLVRRERPGSIETADQERLIVEFSATLRHPGS